MGELIVMPKRENSVENTAKQEVECANDSTSVTCENSPIDLSVWKNAPRERTPGYFPTYSTVSKAMQTALRG